MRRENAEIKREKKLSIDTTHCMNSVLVLKLENSDIVTYTCIDATMLKRIKNYFTSCFSIARVVGSLSGSHLLHLLKCLCDVCFKKKRTRRY